MTVIRTVRTSSQGRDQLIKIKILLMAYQKEYLKKLFLHKKVNFALLDLED